MTVLFCDLVGSSALAVSLDPEEFAELIVAYRERCVAVVARYGGYISRYVGDGVLACFGYPRAVGRDAQAAVGCGLALVREISQLARDTALRGGRDLAVRIGIETGLVVAGRLGSSGAAEPDGLVGTAPNVAARLQSLADRNGIVIGAAAYELVAEAFHCEEIPDDHLVRIEPRTRAFAVRGAAAQPGERYLTRRRVPLVNRRTVMGLIRECWAQAAAGSGRTVLLAGEAGMGKSRLCQELLEELAPVRHHSILLRCTPQTASSAFYPVIERLRYELSEANAASERTDVSAEAISRFADRFGLRAGSGPAVLNQILGVDGGAPIDSVPAARRRLILDTLRAWLIGHARDCPVLIVAEDLQWSDPSLLELLRELTGVLASHRILLIATHRSGFVPPIDDGSSVLRISLSSLNEKHSRHLLAALSPDQTGEAYDAILAKSDGVPLFLEEFALSTADAVPRTLQQLFTARLDALGHLKRLVQCAAVLDPDIDADLLVALAGLAHLTVRQGIEELIGAEWLVRVATPHGRRFAFRHALLREAASESMLRVERRTMHARAAVLLRDMRADFATERPEVVAHHHMLGGQSVEALRCYVQAARRALQAAALSEAETHVRHGMTALQASDPDERIQSELELQVVHGHVLIARRGYANESVRQAFEDALATALRAPRQVQTTFALRGLASYYQVRGPLSRAETICEQLVPAAEQTADPLVLVDALRRRGWNRVCMGRLVAGEADLARALAIYDPDRRLEHVSTAGHDPQILALANLAWLSIPRYGLDSAAEQAVRAATAAHVSSHAFSACYGLVLAAFILQRASRWDEARPHVIRAREIAGEKGFVYWVALAEVALGFDQSMRQGQVGPGVGAMRVGLASYCETQGELLRPFILCSIADAEVAGGDPDAGRTALEEAMEAAKRLQAYGFLPDLLLRYARLLEGAALDDQRQSTRLRGAALATEQGAIDVLRQIGTTG